MFIYFILTCICAGLSVLVLPKSRDVVINQSKAIFNYAHWTLIWTILFVYSIEVSAFAVFFGQLFKRRIYFSIVAYSIRDYFLSCSFIGKTSRCSCLDHHIYRLLSCSTAGTKICSLPVSKHWTALLHSTSTAIWTSKWLVHCRMKASDNMWPIVVGDIATLQQLYSNIFDYPLYIGVCLLLMLVYSVIYFLLAIYVERLNPGEFGVSQPWNYLWKRSHSKSSILRRGTNGSDDGYAKTRNSSAHGNHWLELSRSDRQKTAAMSIDHLNKVIISFLQ